MNTPIKKNRNIASPVCYKRTIIKGEETIGGSMGAGSLKIMNQPNPKKINKTNENNRGNTDKRGKENLIIELYELASYK
jgi:hypothetical protein